MNKLLVSLLLALPSLALAGHSNHILDVGTSIVKIEQATGRCLNNPDNFTTVGMKICVGDAFTAYNDLLNSEYQNVMGDSSISQDEKDLLRKSSRAWIAYKDAQCEWMATSFGGSLYGLEVTVCLNGLTSERIMEIVERYYQEL